MIRIQKYRGLEKGRPKHIIEKRTLLDVVKSFRIHHCLCMKAMFNRLVGVKEVHVCVCEMMHSLWTGASWRHVYVYVNEIHYLRK